MKLLLFIPFLFLGILAIRRLRWAYVSFIVLGLLYFPATVQFRVEPKRCELTFDLNAAVQSLSNFGHIISFFVFFLITAAQFRQRRWQSLVWTVVLTMAMGIAVEAAEGLSGIHHCKTLDLVPALAGALLGLIAVLLSPIIAKVSQTRR